MGNKGIGKPRVFNNIKDTGFGEERHGELSQNLGIIDNLKEEIEKLKDKIAELYEINQGLGIRNTDLMVRSNAVTVHIKWLEERIESLSEMDYESSFDAEICQSEINGYECALENIKREAME